MISISNLSIQYGDRVLFKDVAFALPPKQKMALAGKNGAGKSTLMKCLAGVEEPKTGKMEAAPGFKICYLPQEGIHRTGISVYDEVLSGFEDEIATQNKIDQLSDELHHLDKSSEQYLEHLQLIGELEFDQSSQNLHQIKPKIESILFGLGFSKADLTKDCSEFSGGWQMRMALAKILVLEPDLLLLDEPTNHLDIDTQYWLENYLMDFKGAVLLISHDQGLLDKLCNKTLALHHGKAEMYHGNYSYYLKAYVERKEVLKKQAISQQREIEKIQQFISRFRSQASKAAQVQSRIKQLNKIEVIEIEDDESYMQFHFAKPPACSHHLLKMQKGYKAYGEKKILENFDFELTFGEHIALVGANGAGKSTFCRLISQQETLDTGGLEVSAKVAIAYFSQNHVDELNPDLTVLETVESSAAPEQRPLARSYLGCFLFQGDDVFKTIGVLSGGERSRVALVKMLMQPANLLVLDEPTNHLDIISQQILQQALKDYQGSIIIVSHNRDFLDPIVEKTIEFRAHESPRIFNGNLTYYLDKRQQEQQASSLNAANKAASAPKPTTLINQSSTPSNINPVTGKKLSPKELRKMRAEARAKEKANPITIEGVESSILKLEAAEQEINVKLSNPELFKNTDQMQPILAEHAVIKQKLVDAYSQWDKLSV